MNSLLRISSLLAAAGLLASIAACGGDAAPVEDLQDEIQEEAIEPIPEDEVEAPLVLGPWMTVSGAGVSLSEGEGLPAQRLTDGEIADIYDGIIVAVEAETRIAMGWPAVEDDPDTAFATGELLGGGELRVEASDPELRSVVLEQREGTGRYGLIASEDGPADLTVSAGSISAHASAGGSSFIISYDHAAAAPAANASANGETIMAAHGDTSDAEPPAHVWVIVDEGELTVSTVTTVAAQGDQSAAQSITLTAGQAAAFTSEGEVALAIALEPAEITSWYEGVADGSISQAIAELPQQEAPVQAVAVSEEVLPPAAEPVVAFTADQTEIQLGQCTMLRWSVTDVLFTSLEGNDVPDEGSKEVCPTESWTFTLAHTGMDGKDRTNYVGIKVVNPNAAQRDEDDDEPPPPPPTATPCVGEECEVEEPPPASSGDPNDPGDPGPPPLEPLPTLPPAPVPTDPPPPPPDPTEVPPAPEPTDPPAPEPTDPPAPEPDPTDPVAP